MTLCIALQKSKSEYRTNVSRSISILYLEILINQNIHFNRLMIILFFRLFESVARSCMVMKSNNLQVNQLSENEIAD